ncbi:hypothetical protein Tco_0241403, partial [Tanacetum coccineum]
LQAKFDEEVRLARENDEANVALIEELNDIRDRIETDYEMAQRLQAEEQEELTIEEKSKFETREEESSKRAGDELEQENAKKQKVDDDQEIAELQSMMKIVPDEEEVAVDAIPLATKPPSIVD